MESHRIFAHTTQGIALKGTIGVLMENLPDETLVFTPSGVQLLAVNQSKNAMISVLLPA
jgi:hypothetical protein